MQLTKYKLGDLIVQRREKNKNFDVPIRGVSKEGFIKPKQQEADTSIYNVFYRNDFVFNPARMELNSIALNLEFDKALCSSLYEVFYVKDESIVLPEYLNLHIKREEFARYCDYIGLGSAREYCRFANISGYEIYLPSIDKQQEIVEADRLIKRRIHLNEQMIQHLEATAQALYRKMFVDNIDKENLPKGWRFSNLGDFCELITKGTTPSNYQAKGMISFIKAESFMPNHSLAKDRFAYIDEYTHTVILKRSILCENDVLFTIAGTLGKFCMVTKDYLPANTNQAVAIIRVNKQKIHPQVLFTMLLSGIHEDYCKRNIQQAVQANLSLETLHNMPLLYPPTNTLALFHKQIEPVIDTLFIKYKEIEKLTELQSLLLAKMGQ